MPDQTQSTLKPCPFCGGEPTSFRPDNDDAYDRIKCLGDCEVNPEVWGYSETEAAGKWNKRA